jgi:hypothetical protein
MLEPEWALLDRCLERNGEKQIGQGNNRNAESGRGNGMTALDSESQRKQKQAHAQRESETLIERHGERGDRGNPDRMRQILPREVCERFAPPRMKRERKTKQDEQACQQLGHHPRAGKGKRAHREIAAQSEYQKPEDDKYAADDVIGTNDQACVLSRMTSARSLAPARRCPRLRN